jgi:hypothetical protein
MRTIKMLSALFLLGTIMSFYPAPKPVHSPQGWSFIGDKIAAYGTDRDVLTVTGNDAFRKIKLRITGAPLHIIDMDVYFENGTKQNVELRKKFAEGSESRVIDFPGGMRRIQRIEFLYETIGFIHGKARVAVWGFK